MQKFVADESKTRQLPRLASYWLRPWLCCVRNYDWLLCTVDVVQLFTRVSHVFPANQNAVTDNNTISILLILNNAFYLLVLYLPREARSASAVLLSQVVRLSVCPTVTLMYRGRVSWVSSKVITPIISLGSSLLGGWSHNIGNLVQEEHPKFGWNRVGSLLSAENLQYL